MLALRSTPRSASVAVRSASSSGPAINVGCPTPTTFCTAAVNGSGTQAFIGYNGSTSIADNNFNLTCTGASPSSFGIFFISAGQFDPGVSILGTNGLRCIGGMAAGGSFRTGITAINGGGNATKNIDFTNPIFNSGPAAIVAGAERFFQFNYRDLTQVAGFTTSDGIAVNFCPVIPGRMA